MLSHIVFRRGVVSVSVSVYVVIAARSFGVVILGRLDILSCFFFLWRVLYIIDIPINNYGYSYCYIPYKSVSLQKRGTYMSKICSGWCGGILILQFVARMFRHGGMSVVTFRS